MRVKAVGRTGGSWGKAAARIGSAVRRSGVRLLSWDTLMDFLSAVASHVSSGGDVSNVARIQSAMGRALWDSLIVGHQDLGSDWGELELTLEGRADFYFSGKDSKHFRESHTK